VSDPRIIVSDDPTLVVADSLVAAAARGAQIALTGGSTPRLAYERAAAAGGDWSRSTLWFGDERCVSPEHEHSNYGMAKAALLDRLAGPQPEVRRIAAERGPGPAAEAYQRDLTQALGPVPRLDLVLLGLGSDGHCASLFPADPALEAVERLAVGVEHPGLAPFVPRVTLTLVVLNAAREVVFLVTGAGKSKAVARAFAGPATPAVPASLVRPTGRLMVVLDDAAGQRL